MNQNIQINQYSYCSASYSQEGEDILLKRIFEPSPISFYIDIGAHHPYRFSNTYIFYENGARGINIDATPNSMGIFEQVRPKDINLELAISDKNETITYYLYNEPALNTFSEELVKERSQQKKFKSHYQIIEQRKLQTYTLEQVLDRYLPNNVTIDFLSVDVEGLDYQVLKSNNWQKYKPKVILFEDTSLQIIDNLLKSPVDLLLRENGYQPFSKLQGTFIYIENKFYQAKFLQKIVNSKSNKNDATIDRCLKAETNLVKKDEWQLTTPVVFIIFNRPDTTAKVFEAIRQAKPPKLLVIADGARIDKPGEAEKCAAARAIINQVDWQCEVLTNYSDVNLGCRKRVSSGLDWVFEQVEEAIILEDDCLPHPTFFRYCQELLEKYRDDEHIMMISGNNFQFGRKRNEYSYYFSHYSHIWGWASWRRAWTKYDDSMQSWSELKNSSWLNDVLQNEQAVAYWAKIFQSVEQGFSSWAYIWLLTSWTNNGLCVLPEINLVSNIGFGSGTHTTVNNSPLANIPIEEIKFPLQHPSEITRNLEADDFTEKYIFSGGSRNSKMTFISYAQNFEDVLLNRIFKYKIKGFYLDVGALHPTSDSVTKAFYDRGWSGINIEPIKDYYNLFEQERPRDINLNIALSNSSGKLDFFEVVGQLGNSTLNKEIAYKIAKQKGLDVEQHTVSVETLAEVCQEYVNRKIDFLKIDVEGLEEEVILGGDWKKFRPTVLVIETTLPNTNIRQVNNIATFLKRKNYQQVFFDGINDYYIAEESSDLSKHFSHPVNVLDFYVDYRIIEQQKQINKLSRTLNLNNYQPQNPQLSNTQSEKIDLVKPIIIIDGIFFQLSQNGIARVWKSLLEEWENKEFGKHIIVLDRAGTAPKVPGIQYRTIPAYSYNDTDADREMLQQVCYEEKADLFISTYYTTPLSTPSVFMAYDMIPELLGEKLSIPMWQEKHYGINHASAYISISENTARDLHKLFPHASSELVTVAPCGIQNIFTPASTEEIDRFKAKYNISKPYFVLVGDRVGVNGYKNTSLFFNAFSQIPNSQDFEIVCVGSQTVLEPQLRAYVPDATVHLLKLDDNELRIAYSGAIALVYPSKYEGFGLPVLEAMACGCPVITCPNGSIPEVGGEAVLYVNSDDVDELINKLLDVQQPEVRQSLIAAGLEQAKKFSWSSMAEQVSTALLEAVDLPPKKSLDAPVSIKELISWIEQYQKDLSDLSAIERLRQVRKQLADLWLELPAEEIAIAYRSEIGKTHNLLLDSGIRNEQLTDREQAFVTNLLSHIDEKLDNPKAIQYLLALMQYRYASELSVRLDLNTLPYWLLQDYLGFMLFSPAYFQDTGEVNSYYHYLEQFVNFIHGNISSNPDSQLWQNIANYFAEKANFIPLYFNENNLKSIYQKRAEIIELYLKNRNLPIEHEFAERSPQRQKIRLGILAYHFGVQTETFATLPIYKHLNRDLFEIILFPIKMSNHRLERYCAGHSDELIVLPSNLREQVRTIREADLDILFISTNVTAVTNQITLLASHRLARIQMVDANSPVSTGMHHIDYYISSKLSEPKENAQSHYTEKLITLDVPPQCFDFATEEQIVATTSLSRDSLGIDPNAIVYISGANFYKILPEVELTWTKIINQVPNSVLVLYPFNPNWSSSYPVTAFRKRISNTFAKYGLSEERLIILDPAPNRADVQERLKLADIYLDSYPYSGMTSLIDPLQVGLPSIVLEGKTSRSQKGASLLRSLQVTNLITDSEESYIQLAVELGTNPELRKQKSDRIFQKMQQNPNFLDSRSYSAQMGALFQQLFQKHQADTLANQLRLRDINLVMFPDWQQAEESLYEDFANVLKTMSSNPDKSRMTLLIDTDGIDGEDANWLFSSVAMNLLMEEAVDIADDLEVSLLDDLSENEWQLLLSLMQGRIGLDNENQNAIAKAKAQSLKIYS